MTLCRSVLAAACCLLTVAAGATDSAKCDHERLAAVTGLAALPPEIAAELRQPGATADHGAPFEATDVVGPERLPGRRFDIAGVGNTHAFAAVEQGGMGYSVEIWSFERNGGRWTGRTIKHGVIAPSSLRELLYFTCAGYERFAPKEREVIGSLPPDGSMFLSFIDVDRKLWAYKLSSGAKSPGAPVYVEIRNGNLLGADQSQQLPERERTLLRRQLHSLEAKIQKDDDDTRRVVTQFLSVLGRAQ